MIGGDQHAIQPGKKLGRESDSERIYFNAVGLAFLDVAISEAMYLRAKQAKAGTPLQLQEDMVFEHPDIANKVKL